MGVLALPREDNHVIGVHRHGFNVMTTNYPSPGHWVYRPGKERPLGVALLAVIIGLIGLLFLIVGLLAILGSFVVGFHHTGIDLGFGIVSGSLLVVGVISLIFGGIMLALALGLWHLEQWALVLSIVVFGVLCVLDILSQDIFAVIWGILVFYMLLVRDHFT